jgi:hypothetical protein
MLPEHQPVEPEVHNLNLGHLSFEHVEETDHLTIWDVGTIFALAVAIWLGTLIIGGAVLASAISFVAGLFRTPEFGALQNMGFVMAGVLGFALAVCFVFHAVHDMDELD